MITAIIRNKENTLVFELPHSIYDIYEKLQSIGIRQPPKQIPLTDNEDEDIGVKLFSESDFGQHLLLTLDEKNTIADANMLTNASTSSATPKTQTAKLRLFPMKPRLFERYMSDTYPAKAYTESNAISKQKKYRHLPDAVYGGRKPFVPSSRTRSTKATPS